MGAAEGPWAELEEAVETFLTAVGQPGLLIDWVLVAHRLHPVEEGSDGTTTSYVGAQYQPMYRSLGLLEYGAELVRSDIEDGKIVGDADGNDGF